MSVGFWHIDSRGLQPPFVLRPTGLRTSGGFAKFLEANKLHYICSPNLAKPRESLPASLDNDTLDNKIETYSTLWNLVDIDQSNRKLKDIATLFLNAMNDWPTQDQSKIADFVQELKEYFGSPITVEKIEARKFNEQNAWQVEAGSSIAELIDTSTRFCNESNFDNILKNILDFYEQEFNKMDFIAILSYRTTDEGGRLTPAKSGYRPQVKFDFTEMQTSGQQTFIDKDTVFPGDTVEAKIKILSPDYFAGCLTEGMQFEFREGATVIGTGEIKYIVNDKLEKASR
ncbi:MAG: hypothetical protein JNL75_07895 [Chitinophagales bacterium]|nr:hypothetical protein [Chitinophagales bacterium]